MPLPERVCEQCGRTFRPKTKQQIARYCGRACYALARSLEPIPCAYCGEMFSPPHAVNIYCSKACSNRARRTTAESRFWKHVQRGGADECWEWQSGTDKAGYGAFMREPGNQIGAHRYSWILTNGDIPDGLWVLHHCDNPPCVNPKHLFLGTHQDNIDDMMAKGRYRNPHWEK